MSKPIQAYPSVSSSLSSLPRVKTMSDVSLHHHMYAQQAQDGQRKLQQALGKPPTKPVSPPCVPAVAVSPDDDSANNHAAKIEVNAFRLRSEPPTIDLSLSLSLSGTS
ncbi:Endo-chitosanase [Mycena chlorophos]|uniref:Endo-chitosanase n=1 Tax=Mycena chlorophos TaxID=658473 RepID=A0A8H6W7C3_MYCCL|nr:Endo-chitosanase [Mycena chlorophos]